MHTSLSCFLPCSTLYGSFPVMQRYANDLPATLTKVCIPQLCFQVRLRRVDVEPEMVVAITLNCNLRAIWLDDSNINLKFLIIVFHLGMWSDFLEALEHIPLKRTDCGFRLQNIMQNQTICKLLLHRQRDCQRRCQFFC